MNNSSRNSQKGRFKKLERGTLPEIPHQESSSETNPAISHSGEQNLIRQLSVGNPNPNSSSNSKYPELIHPDPSPTLSMQSIPRQRYPNPNRWRMEAD